MSTRFLTYLSCAKYRRDDEEFEEEYDEEDDMAYIRLFAKAVNTDVNILLDKLTSAKNVIAKTNSQHSNISTEWSTRFVSLMREAQTCYVFNTLSHGSDYIITPRVFDEVIGSSLQFYFVAQLTRSMRNIVYYSGK